MGAGAGKKRLLKFIYCKLDEAVGVSLKQPAIKLLFKL